MVITQKLYFFNCVTFEVRMGYNSKDIMVKIKIILG